MEDDSRGGNFTFCWFISTVIAWMSNPKIDHVQITWRNDDILATSLWIDPRSLVTLLFTLDLLTYWFSLLAYRLAHYLNCRWELLQHQIFIHLTLWEENASSSWAVMAYGGFVFIFHLSSCETFLSLETCWQTKKLFQVFGPSDAVEFVHKLLKVSFQSSFYIPLQLSGISFAPLEHDFIGDAFLDDELVWLRWFQEMFPSENSGP